jgi:hypothetical protein
MQPSRAGIEKVHALCGEESYYLLIPDVVLREHPGQPLLLARKCDWGALDCEGPCEDPLWKACSRIADGRYVKIKQQVSCRKIVSDNFAHTYPML